MARNYKPADPRGGHVRIYWEIIDSMAWRVIGYSAHSLYGVMRRKLTSTNNGNISASLGDLKHYGWSSPTTLAKALRELLAVGLIAVTRQGGIAYGQKVCNLYRFTDEQVYEHPKIHVSACPATNEWRNFSTVAAAKAAIKAAHANAKPSDAENKLGIQKMERADTYSVASSGFTDTDSVEVAESLVQKLEQSPHRKTGAKPLRSLAVETSNHE